MRNSLNFAKFGHALLVMILFGVDCYLQKYKIKLYSKGLDILKITSDLQKTQTARKTIKLNALFFSSEVLRGEAKDPTKQDSSKPDYVI